VGPYSAEALDRHIVEMLAERDRQGSAVTARNLPPDFGGEDRQDLAVTLETTARFRRYLRGKCTTSAELSVTLQRVIQISGTVWSATRMKHQRME